MDVTLPSGQVITGIPDGTTKEQIMQKAISSGMATSEDFGVKPQGIGKNILGGIETAGVMLGSAIAEPLAGLAGISAAIAPGGQTGAEAVESARQRLAPPSYADVLGGQASQQQMQSIGEFVEPALEVFEGAENALGQATLDATGSPELAAIAHTLPTATLEALGLGAFKGAKPAARSAANIADQGVDLIPQRTIARLPREKRTQALISQIQEKNASIKTLGKGVQPRAPATTLTGKFTEKMKVKGDNLVDMPFETNAVKQGFDKGIVADIKDASASTKRKMGQMLSLKERGLDQARFGATNRPSNIVGDALMERVNVVIGANKTAGKKIGDIAKRQLRGMDIDINDAVIGFDDSLQDFGISIAANGNGGFRADFENSVLPKGDRGAINEAIRVMNIKGAKGIDAETVHDMKKILDNHISYGKTKDGLSADAESILRSFRAGLDEALDTRFPEYDAANLAYAETIDAINKFQDVAGKKLDLTSPSARSAAGQEMRKVLSNYGSRQRLVDAVDQIEATASKYKGHGVAPDGTILIEDMGAITSKFDDDLLSLTLFDNELDGRFTPSARGGFENLVSRKVTRAAQSAASPNTALDLGVQAAGLVGDKLKGVTDETAFKAMRDLLAPVNPN